MIKDSSYSEIELSSNSHLSFESSVPGASVPSDTIQNESDLTVKVAENKGELMNFSKTFSIENMSLNDPDCKHANSYGSNNSSGDNSSEDDIIDKYICKNNKDRFQLVDKAFDDMGAGKFHVYLYVAAASAFAVEAAEMNMTGMLIAQLKEDWNASEKELSTISSFTGIGMIFGAMILGRYSDIVGRKKIFHLSLTLCVLFGFISSFATTVYMFAISRLFLGFAYGGNTVSASTLLMESVPTNWRGFFTAMITFAFTFGYIFVVVLAWIIMEPWGWQWLVRIVAFLGLPAIGLLFFIPESIRFSVKNEDYEKCVKTVAKIAHYNNVPTPSYFNIENLIGRTHKLSRTESLVSFNADKVKCYDKCQNNCTALNRILQTPPIIPLMLLWFLNSFGGNILVFLPLELQDEYTNVENTKYKVALALSIGQFFGSCIVLYLSSRVYRRTEFKIGLSTVGLSLFFITNLKNAFSIIMMLLILNSIGMSITFHALYTYTPEVFNTKIRVTALSFCQFCHRLAPVVAPYLVTYLSKISLSLCGLVFSLFSGFCLIICILFLRKETLGQAFEESSEDVDDIGIPIEPSSDFSPLSTEIINNKNIHISLSQNENGSTISQERKNDYL